MVPKEGSLGDEEEDDAEDGEAKDESEERDE